MCVSHDDLLAPYHEDKAKQYKELCEVLIQEHGVPLSFKEFFREDEHEGKQLYTTNCLTFVEISTVNNLLVVNCAYNMSKHDRNSDNMGFAIAPNSIEFHLFEAIAP